MKARVGQLLTNGNGNWRVSQVVKPAAGSIKTRIELTGDAGHQFVLTETEFRLFALLGCLREAATSDTKKRWGG